MMGHLKASLLPKWKLQSGNWSVKGPMLGSADKYASLLLLALPVKPVFHLQFFLNKATFFDVKKVGSNPTFCFHMKKIVLHE